MPVMDGYALCKALRDDEFLKQIPFIFYTATFIGKKDEELALSLGADRFLIKPQEPESLMEIIRQVLADRHISRVPQTGPQDCNDQKLMREYNEALFRKLEKKMADLERVNQELEQKIDEQKRLEEQLRQAQKWKLSVVFRLGLPMI